MQLDHSTAAAVITPTNNKMKVDCDQLAISAQMSDMNLGGMGGHTGSIHVLVADDDSVAVSLKKSSLELLQKTTEADVSALQVSALQSAIDIFGKGNDEADDASKIHIQNQN